MSIGEFLANWRPAPLAISDLGFLQQSSVYGMVAHYLRVKSPCSLFCPLVDADWGIMSQLADPFHRPFGI
jgi:hypothetical protein